MFFSAESIEQHNLYDFVRKVAEYADQHDYHSLWIPERHFAEFGAIFTNPPIILAALSSVTQKIGLRAGSFIAPLHDTIRAAENWSVVDNLSRGRIGVSFGSGWNVNDFILFPDRYEKRHEVMYQQIDNIKTLWSGQSMSINNSFNQPFSLQLYPRPFQKQLPIWVTTSGHPDTYKSAAQLGANILTHMINQDLAILTQRISEYHATLDKQGYNPQAAEVTLMLHTFLGAHEEEVLTKSKQPFREYLRKAINLEQQALRGGGSISGGLKAKNHDIPEDILEELLDLTFEKYFTEASLLGSINKCMTMVETVKAIGVTEIACLIDFGVPSEDIFKHFDYLNQLKNKFT